jgi:hypothetical protein
LIAGPSQFEIGEKKSFLNMCETDEQRIELIKKYVGVYNDFKPGISFK